jgi:hypothetical protein
LASTDRPFRAADRQGARADLISTCPIRGLHLQRAPYGFNAVANDYTPTSDLDILFVSGHWLGRPDGLPK